MQVSDLMNGESPQTRLPPVAPILLPSTDRPRLLPIVPILLPSTDDPAPRTNESSPSPLRHQRRRQRKRVRRESRALVLDHPGKYWQPSLESSTGGGRARRARQPTNTLLLNHTTDRGRRYMTAPTPPVAVISWFETNQHEQEEDEDITAPAVDDDEFEVPSCEYKLDASRCPVCRVDMKYEPRATPVVAACCVCFDDNVDCVASCANGHMLCLASCHAEYMRAAASVSRA